MKEFKCVCGCKHGFVSDLKHGIKKITHHDKSPGHDVWWCPSCNRKHDIRQLHDRKMTRTFTVIDEKDPRDFPLHNTHHETRHSRSLSVKLVVREELLPSIAVQDEHTCTRCTSNSEPSRH